jgi:hypothetical protein
MCLTTITQTFNPPDPKVRTGWRFVEKRDGRFYPPYYGNGRPYADGWAEADVQVSVRTNPQNVYWDDRPTYTSGFHVFPSREEARKAKRILKGHNYGVMHRLLNEGRLALVKVEVRNVTYEGIDGTSTDSDYMAANIKTLVAKEMRIIGEVKD